MTKSIDRKIPNQDRIWFILVMVAVTVLSLAIESPIASAQTSLDRFLSRPTQPAADGDESGSDKAAGSVGGLRPLSQRGGAGSDSGSESSAGEQSAQLMFGSAPFDLQSLQPLFMPPKPNAESQSGPVLQHEAEKTLQAGDQTTASQLMFGHMAAEYESAQPTLSKVKFSKLLLRPVWNLRFGVSMSVRDAGINDEDPNPIPAEVGGLASRARTTASASPDRPPARRNTGLSSLAEAFRSRGPDRRTRTAPIQPRTSSSDPRIARSRAGGAVGSAAGKGAGPKDAELAKPEPKLEEMLGLVAQVVGEEFSTRHERGDFGPLLVDLSNTLSDRPAEESIEGLAPATSAPTPAGGQGSIGGSGLQSLGAARRPQSAAQPVVASVPGTDSTATQVLTSAHALPIWRPGIVSLGNGSSKAMIEKARKAKLDFLIHFDVVLKVRTGSPVQNISRCRLINVATAKSIGLSKVMDSNEEAKLEEELGGREYVNARLENLMSILDRDVKVVELPKLTPEAARRRLGMLLGSSQQRSLQTLAEIRVYEMRQLLTRDEVEAAFDMVGGSDSLLFLYGSAEERASMARTWAAESAKQKGDS